MPEFQTSIQSENTPASLLIHELENHEDHYPETTMMNATQPELEVPICVVSIDKEFPQIYFDQDKNGTVYVDLLRSDKGARQVLRLLHQDSNTQTLEASLPLCELLMNIKRHRNGLASLSRECNAAPKTAVQQVLWHACQSIQSLFKLSMTRRIKRCQMTELCGLMLAALIGSRCVWEQSTGILFDFRIVEDAIVTELHSDDGVVRRLKFIDFTLGRLNPWGLAFTENAVLRNLPEAGVLPSYYCAKLIENPWVLSAFTIGLGENMSSLVIDEKNNSMELDQLKDASSLTNDEVTDWSIVDHSM